MGHNIGLNDFHLICTKDLECSSKISNSFCDRNSSCSCDKGYKYYTKFNKCIFSNYFHCNTAERCANLDPRLTCVDNLCTCKEKEKRSDNYLCSAFKKYCYKGYRYNVETTDCVFVGDLTINQENLDQSVEIFVIVLFFITSALFIASCLNNYKNERAEKLRRRIAQQQTMSLFAEQQRRSNFLNSSNSMNEVVSLTDGNMFPNQLRTGPRHDSFHQSSNRHYRHPNMFDHQKTNSQLFDDLPPSYESLFNPSSIKNERPKYYSNPLHHQVITVNSLVNSAPLDNIESIEILDGLNDASNNQSNDRPNSQLNGQLNSQLNSQLNDRPNNQSNDQPNNQLNDQPNNQLNDQPNDQQNIQPNNQQNTQPNNQPNNRQNNQVNQPDQCFSVTNVRVSSDTNDNLNNSNDNCQNINDNNINDLNNNINDNSNSNSNSDNMQHVHNLLTAK